MTEPNIIYAPKVNSTLMWHMKEEAFAEWRKQNDYPRIISFFKDKLPEFENWMQDQDISDDLLLQHSPSSFIKEESCLYIYKILDSDKNEKEIISTTKYAVNETFFHQNLVLQRKEIIPYPNWYEIKTGKRANDFSLTSKYGRSHRMLSELELLDLGNCHLSNLYISSRNLDFVNISNTTFTNCICNGELKLWFSSAVNIQVEGDFHFINAYKTSFYEVFNRKFDNLKLVNGTYQSWKLVNCRINLSASNVLLHSWKYIGWDFNATITNTDIQACVFKNSPVLFPIGYGRAKDFHAHIKRLYSQIGKKKEASNHYFLEKTFERKSFLYVKENYRNQYYRAKSRNKKILIQFVFFCKYIYSSFLNFLWGYGERPGRIFTISIFTILAFSFMYCYFPDASISTKGNFINSLYYSIVTFTTLGYGDISQTNQYLKLLSAIEALLGMTFWGILIAGFTSNSKDY